VGEKLTHSLLIYPFDAIPHPCAAMIVWHQIYVFFCG